MYPYEIGTPEHPYRMFLSPWMARFIEEREGVTAQEYADEFFAPTAVEVVIMQHVSTHSSAGEGSTITHTLTLTEEA